MANMQSKNDLERRFDLNYSAAEAIIGDIWRQPFHVITALYSINEIESN